MSSDRDVWSNVTDYIKYTTAGAVGALVLGIGLLPSISTYSVWERRFLVVSWIFFGLSAIAGTVAQAAIPLLIAAKSINLEAPTFTWPARLHQIFLALAAVSLGTMLVEVTFDNEPLSSLKVPSAASALRIAENNLPYNYLVRKVEHVELIRGVDSNRGEDMTWSVDRVPRSGVRVTLDAGWDLSR